MSGPFDGHASHDTTLDELELRGRKRWLRSWALMIAVIVIAVPIVEQGMVSGGASLRIAAPLIDVVVVMVSVLHGVSVLPIVAAAIFTVMAVMQVVYARRARRYLTRVGIAGEAG